MLKRETRPEDNRTSRIPPLFLLAIIAILGLNVILEDFLGSNATFVRIRCVFDAVYDACFERLALFDQFGNAFRVGVLNDRETLDVAGLPTAL